MGENISDALKLGKNGENSVCFDTSKQKMIEICDAIFYLEDEKIDELLEKIKAYSKNKETSGRLIYSEISSYIFGLNEAEDEDNGKFFTNIEKLVNYTLQKKENKELAKIILKIYDHCNLANSQWSMSHANADAAKNFAQMSINKALDEATETISSNMQNELKRIEREYVTILGIFASIVLTFVGVISFSSSIFQNIEKSNFYRLIFIVDLLSFLLFNTVYMLIYFIEKINDINYKYEKWKKRKSIGIFFWVVNAILVIVFILTTVVWLNWPNLFIKL